MRYKTAMIAAFAVVAGVAGQAEARKKPLMSMPPPDISPVESQEQMMSLPHPMICTEAPPPAVKMPKPRRVRGGRSYPNA